MMARKSTYRPVAIQRHFERVAALGCVVCGAPAELHHVTGYSDRMGRITRSDTRVIGLCPTHHRVGAQGGFKQSVEALGHRGFFEEWGIDLLAEAERLWAESEELERRAA
jgi:hypothetical protein